MNTGHEAKESRNRLLTTLAWQMKGKPTYALEGSVFVAGAAVQWLRDGLGIIRSSDEMGPLAASVPDTGGVVFVPAFTGLGAPQWDAYARGTIVGLTRGTTKAHIARAVLEAIACQSAELLTAMCADSGVACPQLRVDGGAAGNDLLMQIQADLLGVPVVRPKVTETTALGAAYLAGLATGVWKSPESLRGQWQVDRVFEPMIGGDERERRLNLWRKAVSRSLDWADA
jgi:glycerol kinase